jgi:hypothetical protein
MLEKLNNKWTLLFAIILFVIIVRKIIKLNKPFDQEKFINQMENQKKLKEKISINMIKEELPLIANYIVN